MNLPDDLLPGDILGYGPTNLLGQVEKIKYGDWENPIAHVELYAGNGMSWASRESGIDLYPFRPEQLVLVKRPFAIFDAVKAAKFFKGINGLPYGNGDNVSDAVGVSDGKPGLNCSHTVAVMLQAGDADVFDHHFPKQEISPRDFKLTPAATVIYP